VKRGASIRVLLLSLPLGAAACAGTADKPEAPRPAVAAPAAAPAPPAPVGAPPVDPRVALAAGHRERAAALEREGDLRRAVEELKIALTIRSDDADAREALRALEGRIETMVAERVKAGRAALARNAQVEARRDFLAALALDPANRAAFEALQNETRETPFITHTVRQGDTLAALAQRYYGDRTRSEVIWETNQLPPNPRLAAGTILKIPEIPGMPFVRIDPRRPAPAPSAPAASPAAPPATLAKAEPPAPDEHREINPLLAEAREALERMDWGEALTDVDKFLSSHPSNPDGLAVKKQALYQQAKAQLDSRRYGDSYRTLVQLTRLEPNYEDGPRLLQQARTRAIEQHYVAGVRLYKEEKLPEAIAEWRIVLEFDAQHANARKNIEQAERLLRGLEQRKKK
jgi:tetratricopeptide (TPR) repeat protein